MRVTVLCGGPSAEREISLRSGAGVAKALKQAGHAVFVSDVSPSDLSGLDTPADVIFPVLHGDFGESGELQEILESRQLPFVGSGSIASALGMDKIAAKKIWRDKNLQTPAWRVLHDDGEFDRAKFQPMELGLPVVVKAIRSGSSIDVYICKTADDVLASVDLLLKKHGECMMEHFIEGTELTIGLLLGKALPPIRIETSHTFFDYSAKYVSGGARHDFDPKLPADVVQECEKLAIKANDALGCRDLARVDLRIDADHRPYLLEINTMPGFTDQSLLPEAAARAGISFADLVDKLVQTAARRCAAVNTGV